MGTRLEKIQRCLIILFVFFEVLAIFPLTLIPSNDIKILGYELFAFMGLAIWLFTPRHNKESVRRSSVFFPLFLVFLGINLVSCFVSLNIGYSLLREFTKLTALFILYVMVADVFYTPKQVWGLFAAICIAVSIASLYGFVQYLGYDPFPWETSKDVIRSAPSTFGNPNFASHAMLPAVILAAGLCTRRKMRWLCIGLLLIFLGHFALTRTRGSILGLAGAVALILITFIVSRKIKSPSRIIAVTFTALLALGLTGIAALALFSNAQSGQPYLADRGISITLRYHSFYGACEMIQDRPWLGHGLGMYQVVAPAYWTPLEKERFGSLRKLNTHVHNEPLEVAVDGGVFAAIVYIAILMMGIYYGLSMGLSRDGPERRAPGMTLAAFFFAFLLDGLFGFNIHVPVSATLLFILAGATAGLWRERTISSSRQPIRYDWFSVSWRLVALACATFIPILGIRDFAAQFLHQRGLGAVHYKAYPDAERCFQKAEQLMPFDWSHTFQLGTTAMKMANPQLATKHFARTLELHPNNVSALFEMAQAWFNLATSSSPENMQTALNEAVTHIERAAQFCPTSPEVHDLWGRASFLHAKQLAAANTTGSADVRKKAWQETEQHLQHAIDYGSKQNDRLYRFMALSRLAREDVLGAQKALIYSLEEKPDEIETWNLLLQCSQKTGQYEAIRTSLDRFIESLSKSKTEPEILCALYRMQAEVLYAGYGDDSAAETIYRQTLKEYPDQIDAWAAFHAFAQSAGREDIVNSTIIQTIKTQPKEGKTPHPIVQAVGLGLGGNEEAIVNGASKLVEALQNYQASSATKPESIATMFLWAADILGAQVQITPLSPKNRGTTYLNLGLIYGACQNYEKAVRFLEQALPELTGSQRLVCLLRRAAALNMAGKTEAAVDAFRQAATEAPSSFEARYGLAQALVRTQRTAEARKEYLGILSSFQLNEKGRATIQQELDALPKPIPQK